MKILSRFISIIIFIFYFFLTFLIIKGCAIPKILGVTECKECSVWV